MLKQKVLPSISQETRVFKDCGKIGIKEKDFSFESGEIKKFFDYSESPPFYILHSDYFSYVTTKCLVMRRTNFKKAELLFYKSVTLKYLTHEELVASSYKVLDLKKHEDAEELTRRFITLMYWFRNYPKTMKTRYSWVVALIKDYYGQSLGVGFRWNSKLGRWEFYAYSGERNCWPINSCFISEKPLTVLAS